MLRIYVYEDLMFYQRYPLSIKLTESHECLDHGHAKAHMNVWRTDTFVTVNVTNNKNTKK